MSTVAHTPPDPPEIEYAVEVSPAQEEFCASAALYRAFCGGVGSGKTWVGAFDLLCRAAPGLTYMVASPTAVMMSDITLPTVREIGEKLGVWGEVKLTPYPTATLTTGATIRFRTADNPERLRGPNLSGIWLDEASLMSRAAYDIAIARLREARGQGWLSATFTPKGPTHWTHEVFATGRPNTVLIRSKTAENPFVSPDFVANLRGQYGDTLFARQELDGAFVSVEGAEFPGDWFTHPDLMFHDWPADLVVKVMALDPSKGTDGAGTDDQAQVMLGVGSEGGKLVLYADADLRRESVQDMCRRTCRLAREFGATGRQVDEVVVEDNATMGLLPPSIEAAQAAERVILPWRTRTSTDRKEFRIVYHLGPPLSRRQIRFKDSPGGRKLLAQLQAFPFGEHDDGPDALSMAVWRAAELVNRR